MENLSQRDFDRLTDAASLLDHAAKSVRVLRSIDWGGSERRRFLDQGRLPTPEYPTVDVDDCLEALFKAEALMHGDHAVFAWLRRVAQALELTVHMLNARGTAAFFMHSKELYGTPTDFLLDGSTRVIDLARHIDGTLKDLDLSHLVMEGFEVPMTAQTFADKLKPHLEKHFQDRAPEIVLEDDLASKALAGSRRIRLRESAMFGRMDIAQLLQHEALVHVATSLNGRSQSPFAILGRSHAGTTQVQEGLAVFAEMVSGSMDPVRFRRLADRVIAIQMAIKGADFKEVFDFYVDCDGDRDEAYDNTRRVFRGGVVTGGAPFTKDMVYLNGLLRVHNFMRSAVSLGRADLIRLMFVGKLDIEDIPALAFLADAGHLRAPQYMPDWAKDLRFLVSYLSYSSFLNRVKLPGLKTYYKDALHDAPMIWDFAERG